MPPVGTLALYFSGTGTWSGLQLVIASELTRPFVVLPVTRDDPPGAVTQIGLCSLRYKLNAEGFLLTAICIKHLINIGWPKTTCVNVILFSKLPASKPVFCNNYHALTHVLFKEA